MAGGARTLSDGKIKYTILLTKPVNPFKPGAAALNAGIDMSDDILSSDFNWTVTASEKIAEKPLSAKNNANALGAGNFSTALTLWLKFDPATGALSVLGNEGWEALGTKGVEVWAYARESGKDSAEVWTDDDVCYLGGSVLVDSAQRNEGSGFIKRRIEMEAQIMNENFVVGPVVP